VTVKHDSQLRVSQKILDWFLKGTVAGKTKFRYMTNMHVFTAPKLSSFTQEQSFRSADRLFLQLSGTFRAGTSFVARQPVGRPFSRPAGAANEVSCFSTAQGIAVECFFFGSETGVSLQAQSFESNLIGVRVKNNSASSAQASIIIPLRLPSPVRFPDHHNLTKYAYKIQWIFTDQSFT
jgi:hypothetical protein